MRIRVACLLSSVLLAACGASSSGGAGPGDDGGASGDNNDAEQPGDAQTHDSPMMMGLDSGTDSPSAIDASQDSPSSSDGGADATMDASMLDAPPDAPSDAPFVVAPHPPFPKLVNSGGPVLTNPIVVPVLFPGYDYPNEVAKTMSDMPTLGSFWSDSVSEYGVGPLTVKAPITVSEQAPASTDGGQIVQWLTNKIMNDPAFAGATPQTIYEVYYPKTTTIQGQCGFGGYHDSLTANGMNIPYAVVAECPTFGPLMGVDMVTVAGTHEVIEAATDPYPSSQPAYATIDSNGFAMDIFLQGNEENGDMCTINIGFIRLSNGFLYQRGYSNRAASMNGDPCQPPLPNVPYVGAAPIMPDTVSVQGTQGPGVIIAVGSQKTIEVDLFSSGPTAAPFTVSARQARGVSELAFSWDKTTGVNGDKLHLTITVMQAGGSGYEAFVIQSTADNFTKNAWAGVVTN